MALTASDIYGFVNTRTGRTGNHQEELLAVLIDLSHRGVQIRAETSQALTTGTRNYNVPTDTKRVVFIVLRDSSSIDSAPLVQKTYQEYKALVAGNASNGRPLYYAVENSVIYLDPPPNATTYPNIRIITVNHHADSTTITWDDRLREAIIEGVCWKTLLGLDLGGSLGTPHKAEYLDEVAKLLVSQSSEVRRNVRYSDI